MIGLGIALVVIVSIFLFVLPWVGLPVGIVGLVLAISGSPVPSGARPAGSSSAIRGM
jgi:hypothetical protein